MSSDKYIHSDVEDKIYSYWEKNELFKPQKNSKKFSIVIPPPNVTGSLHMGHALNNSIQDLLTRFYRMNNFETLWQPGTDPAMTWWPTMCCGLDLVRVGTATMWTISLR